MRKVGYGRGGWGMEDEGGVWKRRWGMEDEGGVWKRRVGYGR